MKQTKECNCGCRVVLGERYVFDPKDPKCRHMWELFISHHPDLPKDWTGPVVDLSRERVDSELKGFTLLNESSRTGV